MAAYASLVSLMKVIHDLEHHPSPPISLDKHLVDSVTQHVAYFQEFLHAYNSSPSVAEEDDEESADPLEMRIAATAYAAEDAIESHIMESIHLQRSDNTDANHEKIKSITLCRDRLLGVIVEMDSIKKVVVDAEKTKNNSPVVHDQFAPTKYLAFVAPNETFVGSDGVLLEILEKLAGGRSNLQVIPIVGMGGIGKTFLARSIYARPLVKEHFDICVWATISQEYNTREILCELLSQATCTNKEQLSWKSEDVLGSELHKTLFGRRFLVVMDDIWSIDAWDKIQRFFPSNENGSRVLVTTRLSQLCSQLNNDYNLRMSFLDESSSWNLFSKTVFGDESCPPELKEIGEKIVDKCRGLPLSLVVVGGVLKKMDGTRVSWESVRDNLTSVVNMDNDKLCLRLLKMSYSYLPVYLKPCCLYMGLFGEDEEIYVTRLVNLWVSEGFLKPRYGEALETTARGFLQDLIDRNLVLISKLGLTGVIMSCKMHDLVRDLCLKEAHKEGFYHFIRKRNLPPQGMNTNRRVVIPWKKYDDLIRSMSHTRSMTCYGELPPPSNLGLLRVLRSYKEFGYGNDESFVNSLAFHHVNLRHLDISVSGTCLSLHSVSLFWNLHTLIFSGSTELISVVDFWKMPRLRHIEIVLGRLYLSDPPNFDGDAVVIMENLHTLKRVKNLKCSEGVVKRIPNIKILKMEYLDLMGTENHEEDFCVDNIKYLCRLESLSISNSLFRLHNNLTFPHSLKNLSLNMGIEFEWDDGMLDSIGSLPLLEKLKLLCGSFGKGKWETGEGQFPRLKYLKLSWCWGLEYWTVAEERCDILPRLEHLRLDHLHDLSKVPSELGNINTLKEIRLNYCGERTVKYMKEIFDEEQGGEDQVCFHVVDFVVTSEEEEYLLKRRNIQL